jgi:hypothetical protein
MESTIPSDGVYEELLITADREILNGRHRWKGAIGAGLATKPVLPCRVVDDDDAENIILATLSARKNYPKGGIAYLAGPHIEAAVIRAKAARSKTHFSGQSTDRLTGAQGSGRTHSHGQSTDRLTGVEGSSFDEIAEKLGISVQLLKLASTTIRLFKESDERRQKWLNANLQEAEAWAAWQDAHSEEETAPSWQAWRAERLTDMGHRPEDPKAAAVIPDDYREIYEPKIFNVEPGEGMGLGAINKAVGSSLATKGGGRSDLDTQSPSAAVTLTNKLASFSKTMFGPVWEAQDIDTRLNLAVKIAESTTSWPDEVKNAVASQLLKKR